MLLEGKEGSVNLKTLYKRLNNEYFNGALPTIGLKWNGRLTNAVGKAHVSYINRGRQMKRSMSLFINQYSETIPVADVDIDMKSLKISVSSKYDLSSKDIDAVMLHEMVHIKLFVEKKLGGHHGTPEFDGWIRRLSDQSGLDIPYKESSFKKSPKIKAREGYVMLARQTDGKYGLSTYSVQWMKKNWMDFAEVMTRVMNGGQSKIQTMVYFKINHRAIADYPAKRSLKQISWTMIDDELAEEIKRKGKYWGESFRGGGKFSPQDVGLISGSGLKAILTKYGYNGDEMELDRKGKLKEI